MHGHSVARLAPVVALLGLLAGSPAIDAQIPVEGEVRQLVTFRFLPGRSQEALELYRRDAIPLYRADHAMTSFRGLREVESPVPLDLVVVSAFDGMAGMDESNRALRALAEGRGASIGAIYGAIGALSSSHDDQFVEMLPRLGNGDPTRHRLIALLWYAVDPGSEAEFEEILERAVTPWEATHGRVASTGRFLLSDGWTHLRILGIDSLGEFHNYQSEHRLQPWHTDIRELLDRDRQVILAVIPDFSVR